MKNTKVFNNQKLIRSKSLFRFVSGWALFLLTTLTIAKVPDTLGKINTDFQAGTKVTVTSHSFNKGINGKVFSSVTVDDDNNKWFVTDVGIVSFDGKKWSKAKKNKKFPSGNLNDIEYTSSSDGKKLLIASPRGAFVASLPLAAKSGVTTFNSKTTSILSDNVLSVAIGKGSLRWFGTDKGIFAFRDEKWLSNSYQRGYPERLFRNSPITAMATSFYGDTLYAATEGAGVARVYRNSVDAISGASEYAIWGPIDMPSDKVYSICITPDGTQWFGTNMGVARHIGKRTLENWKVFNTSSGLIDNFVQAIAVDKTGKVWFGTKGGVSVFDGSSWISYTTKDGLTSNNILCITTDKNGVMWFGTDNGVISFNNGEFINYK